MFVRRRTLVLTLVLIFCLFAFVVRRQFQLNYDVSRLYSPKYSKPVFLPGTAKPVSEIYTKNLVMGRLKSEDVSWLQSELPGLNTTIYVVDDDDPNAPYRVPKNKGHEAMVYLTYIIDHYDALPDIVLFFHPHKNTWHNNILLGLDNAQTIRRINDAHVARKGYFNSRCHHDPGCPDWLHVDRPQAEWDLIKKNEERFFTSELWHELHPGAPIPASISQPCCAQFAVSRDRIRVQPRSEYIRYRKWLLNTPIADESSGRIMEYTWQYIFTGQSEFCPPEHSCYCDGYGICFGGGVEFDNWLKVLRQREVKDEIIRVFREAGKGESQEVQALQKEANALNAEVNRLIDDAIKRGMSPQARAVECGRPWADGDGF